MSQANIARKIYAIMSDAGWIAKDGTVNIARSTYSYTTEAQFIAELRPLFIRHQVIILPMSIKDLQIKEKITANNNNSNTSYMTTAIFVYRFIDVESGEHIDIEMAAQGFDTTDKGIYKLATGAFKYALRQTFMIGTGDDPERTDENGTVVSYSNGSGKSDIHGYIVRTSDALDDAKISYESLAKEFSKYGLIPNKMPENPKKLRAIYDYAKSIQKGDPEQSAKKTLAEALGNAE
jgi:hypothetical protein